MKIVAIILIALGAIIMFLSILQTKKIFGLIKENKYRILWKILSYLMFFFLGGYLLITVLLQFDIGDFLMLLMGLIFFFGSLFVYVVVKTGYLTINDLLKTTLFNLELQQSKQTAEAIAQTKSQFLATMSHEIRTPMSGIIAMANLLLKTDLTLEQKDFIETIQVSGDTLLIILNDILDFSKIESGQIELEYQCFNLAE
ncbi:MAG TPA: histidine kinase dimerization/phospho-acceptor domain-containing protein, partial [Allocoleopsis sp.]